MLSRRPQFNFDAMPVVWASNAEFSQSLNAWGVSAPYVEPYLIKVMLEAQGRLGHKDREIKDEIEIFIKQESTHYRIHTLFNREMHRQGYDALKPLEARLKNELDVLLKNRSFEFNLAYCTGFETFTLYMSEFVFDHADDLFEDADPRGADLWRWHLAEEFEHRSVCHSVFARLSGSYATRLHGSLYAAHHLGKFKADAVNAVMSKYREGMSKSELAASIAREKIFNRRFNRYVMPRLLKVLAPFYDPNKATPSAAVQAALHRFAAPCDVDRLTYRADAPALHVIEKRTE